MMALIGAGSPYDLSLEWFPDHRAKANHIFSVCETWNYSALRDIESVHHTNNIELAIACALDFLVEFVRQVFPYTGAEE